MQTESMIQKLEKILEEALSSASKTKEPKYQTRWIDVAERALSLSTRLEGFPPCKKIIMNAVCVVLFQWANRLEEERRKWVMSEFAQQYIPESIANEIFDMLFGPPIRMTEEEWKKSKGGKDETKD